MDIRAITISKPPTYKLGILVSKSDPGGKSH